MERGNWVGGINMYEFLRWGDKEESGFWLASRSAFKLMHHNHDGLYIAFWKLRLRIMKSAEALYFNPNLTDIN